MVGGVDRLDPALELRRLVELARLREVDPELGQQVPVAADRLILHLHVGVEGDEAAVGEPGERIDLGQGHVQVALQPGELGQHRGCAVELRAGDRAAGHRLLGLEVGDRMEVREVPPTDVIGVLGGDLLDVDSAHVAEQHHRTLRSAVPEHRRVVLLLDLGSGVDEDADREVAADLELEDLGRVRRRLVGRVGELDAAGLHPPAGQHLRLDHSWTADSLGRRARLIGGGREPVRGDWDARPFDHPA